MALGLTEIERRAIQFVFLGDAIARSREGDASCRRIVSDVRELLHLLP